MNFNSGETLYTMYQALVASVRETSSRLREIGVYIWKSMVRATGASCACAEDGSCPLACALHLRRLQQVRDDGFPVLRVVFERIVVPLVVEKSDHNLVQDDEAADHEPCRRFSIENDAHGQVDEDFSEVVRTGDGVEEVAPWDRVLESNHVTGLVFPQFSQDLVTLELQHGRGREKRDSEHMIPSDEQTRETDIVSFVWHRSGIRPGSFCRSRERLL